MDFSQFSLEEKVAQLMVIGYSGNTLNPVTEQFLNVGVGGFILFRDNLEPFQTAADVRHQIQYLNDKIPAHLPKAFISIDQEGGQVERLPHRYFPTGLTSRAIALSKHPIKLARQHYQQMARQLRQLGFNLDFFPTLDVNLNHRNPIIGVRSFADDPSTVWQLSEIALQEFSEAGLIAVGKHFPGHGNGTVDSHYDLPLLNFTETELWPFKQAIDAGLPMMLVAHGYYPDLQTTPEERQLPSSASPAIIQELLRKKLGFKGVIITDDMCMGAITKHRSPVEAALASIKAGVDILLYKQSTADEWAVFEALVNTFQSGELPLERLHETLSRILKLKQQLAQHGMPFFNSAEFTPEACHESALDIARQGIGYLSGDASALPIKPNTSLLLVHPDRREMGNYAFDVPGSSHLDDVLHQTGFTALQSIQYPLKSTAAVTSLLKGIQGEPPIICFVTFNPLLNPLQPDLANALKDNYPNARLILASAGTPYDQDVMPTPDLHLGLCSYRPATMQALAETLLQGFASII